MDELSERGKSMEEGQEFGGSRRIFNSTVPSQDTPSTETMLATSFVTKEVGVEACRFCISRPGPD